MFKIKHYKLKHPQTKKVAYGHDTTSFSYHPTPAGCYICKPACAFTYVLAGVSDGCGLSLEMISMRECARVL